MPCSPWVYPLPEQPDAPSANDNAPATPNTVTAFVRLLRFEACFACDMVETERNEWPRPAQKNDIARGRAGAVGATDTKRGKIIAGLAILATKSLAHRSAL